jgi:hypothetical protein
VSVVLATERADNFAASAQKIISIFEHLYFDDRNKVYRVATKEKGKNFPSAALKYPDRDGISNGCNKFPGGVDLETLDPRRVRRCTYIRDQIWKLDVNKDHLYEIRAHSRRNVNNRPPRRRKTSTLIWSRDKKDGGRTDSTPK